MTAPNTTPRPLISNLKSFFRIGIFILAILIIIGGFLLAILPYDSIKTQPADNFSHRLENSLSMMENHPSENMIKTSNPLHQDCPTNNILLEQYAQTPNPSNVFISGYYLKAYHARTENNLTEQALYENIIALALSNDVKDHEKAFMSALNIGEPQIAALHIPKIITSPDSSEISKIRGLLLLSLCAFKNKNKIQAQKYANKIKQIKLASSNSNDPTFIIAGLINDWSQNEPIKALEKNLATTKNKIIKQIIGFQHILALMLESAPTAIQQKIPYISRAKNDLFSAHQPIYAEALNKQNLAPQAQKIYQKLSEKGSFWKIAAEYYSQKSVQKSVQTSVQKTPIITEAEKAIALAIYDLAILKDPYIAPFSINNNPHFKSSKDSFDVNELARLALMLDPLYPPALWLLSQNFQKDNLDETIKLLKKLGKNPIWKYFALDSQILLYDENNQDTQAIKILKKIIIEKPDRRQSRAYLADLLIENHQYQEALSHYNKLLITENKPLRKGEILFGRAIALTKLDKWQNAEQDLLKSIELNPKTPYSMNYLAYEWIKRGQNIQEAIELLARAIALKPDDGYILDSYGWAFYQLKDYQKALSYMQRAVNLEPETSEINDHLGDIFLKLGNIKNALAQWKIAIDLLNEEREGSKEGKNNQKRKIIEEKIKQNQKNNL